LEEPGFTIVDCFELKKKKKNKTLENLCTLARRFDNIILPHEESDVNSEVETLENNYHQVRKRIKNSFEGSLEAWKQIHRTYPLIYRLARTVQTLPYSTSSIERNFSVLKDIKTIKRNRLSVQNLEACLLSKQEFFHSELQFTQKMFEKYDEIMHPKLLNQNEGQMQIEKAEENHTQLDKEGLVEVLTKEEEKFDLSQSNYPLSSYANSPIDREVVESAKSLFNSFLHFSRNNSILGDQWAMQSKTVNSLKRVGKPDLINPVTKQRKNAIGIPQTIDDVFTQDFNVNDSSMIIEEASEEQDNLNK